MRRIILLSGISDQFRNGPQRGHAVHQQFENLAPSAQPIMSNIAGDT
jgi:hypothetical protein